MNKLKYTAPLRQYIFDRNIWIKPDLYLTKTVGSPGFITLLHPKLTNKPQLTSDLKEMLKQIDLCETDEDVREWYKRNNIAVNQTEVPVPPFHVETNLRKWGEIHVEVITIQCSSDDAKYLKYLLVEANSQELWQRGLYVPAGIHLMAKSEVLQNLLSEQQQFIDSVTKFHLSGISKQDMYKKNEEGQNTYELLMKCKGV